MTSPKQVLTHQLVAAVAPHLGSDAAAPAPKAVVKTAAQLAKQVLRHQTKLAKTVKPKATAGKALREVLAQELLAALQPHLAPDDNPTPVLKAVKRLAGQLLKQRRKAAKLLAAVIPKGSKKLFSKELKPFQVTQSPSPRALPASAPTRRAAPRQRPASTTASVNGSAGKTDPAAAG